MVVQSENRPSTIDAMNSCCCASGVSGEFISAKLSVMFSENSFGSSETKWQN